MNFSIMAVYQAGARAISSDMRSKLLVLLMPFVGSMGCVEQSKYAALHDELGKTQEALRKAQGQISRLQAHRYEIFISGGTWRLDTTTGETCILLASDGNWKKPEYQNQSCANFDSFRAQMEAGSTQKK